MIGEQFEKLNRLMRASLVKQKHEVSWGVSHTKIWKTCSEYREQVEKKPSV